MSREPRGRERQRRGREARAPIWAQEEPGRRRPSVTREEIADTALAIADADGLEAVSMRRIASELGVGTMTLYHYVRTKDDLWALIGDRMMGELVIPDDEFRADDWRAAIGAIGRRSREVFRRHPWIVSAMHQGGEIGPNGMRHFEQSLAAVETTGLDPAGRLEIVTLIDDFVHGHALRTAIEEVEVRNPGWRESVEGYVEALLATGDYPHIERLLGDGGSDRHAAWEALTSELNNRDRFETGLEALLDGIERHIARRRA